jgi:hypothetical protein
MLIARTVLLDLAEVPSSDWVGLILCNQDSGILTFIHHGAIDERIIAQDVRQ